MSGERFRVDLRGIVDILSHHLYSSPRVYLRELIQNARDAVVARQSLNPGTAGEISIEVDDGGAVIVRDHGIGLTEDEMRTVLATIGASSKRGDLTQLRRQYLGQFGIGLLSCFLIADRIEVRSRSARSADSPTLSWVGSADGTFTISQAEHPLADAGTEVTVTARADEREWVEPNRVRLLAERFASLLDLPVSLGSEGQAAEVISVRTPPWRASQLEAEVWCRQELGFSPLAGLPIEVGAAGVVGLAFIADAPGRVGNRKGDTIYSRGMFVAENNVQLVPAWAYFVRLALDAGELPLTASRESLQDSVAIAEVRNQIGIQIRTGIERFAASDPVGFGRFLDVHAKGLLAMAATDTDMLDLVMKHVLWETSEGTMTLERLLRVFDRVQYTTSMTEFNAFAPLLRAGKTLLVNGAYVYGGEILRQVQERRGRIGGLRLFDARGFLSELPRPAQDDTHVRGFQAHARAVLDRLGLDLDLREFAPASVPSLFVGETGIADSSAAQSDTDPWADFLSEPERCQARSRLVLNVSSTAVRALASLTDERVRAEAVTGLYVIGLLTAGEKLDDRHTELLSETLHALITAAGGGDAGPGRD
ncbi:HSP90 family protein [Pseudoclavibacter sp. AY1F1]|uniref:HSP90 family protein n=1 Tax=Pseudoclavibacter sp. AY1F1 TaxID=2080583 RepID=UPI0015E2CF22|nr:HSP90 family protein [Pseudoclavibacter sp. AY1F1]